MIDYGGGFQQSQNPGTDALVVGDDLSALTGGGTYWTNPGESPLNQDAIARAQAICNRYGATLVETYDEVGSFLCMMNELQARSMSHDAEVQWVMADFYMYADTVQSNPGWALDRIDERGWPLTSSFSYTRTGQSVHAYVVDSGVRVSHWDLGSRASWSWSYAGTPDDYNGHGTRVATLLGGTTAGVAKNVLIHSVRVLDENNSFPASPWLAPMSRVTKGLNWIRRNHIKPALVNCSLGMKKRGGWLGNSSDYGPIEKAVRRLVARGIPVIVSAGNKADDADDYAPACVAQAITVGATYHRAAGSTSEDIPATFSFGGGSNFGHEVDVYAPGMELYSGNKEGGWDSSAEGTSFAAPLVAGVVAQYLQANPNATPLQVQNWIKNNASIDHIRDLQVGTANRMLYTNW